MKVQNTNINIRIPKRLRDTFINITKEKGTSYSKVVRLLINEYVNKNENCLKNTNNKESLYV